MNGGGGSAVLCMGANANQLLGELSLLLRNSAHSQWWGLPKAVVKTIDVRHDGE